MRNLAAVGGAQAGAEGQLELYAEAPLPTGRGTFRSVVFRDRRTGAEHVALVLGDLTAGVPPVRVHSECLTSEVFGSLKCDCRAQLDRALDHVSARGRGALLYLRQEGRGIGLGNKIRAYALQDSGADTVEANHQLGFPADAREYGLAVHLLRELGLSRIRLMTNNPAKFDALVADGVQVVERVPVERGRNPHNAAYLDTKAAKMGHWLAGAPAPDPASEAAPPDELPGKT
jgi:GTP cyclohydrolase II